MSLESNMQILKDAGTDKAFVSVHRIVAMLEAINLYQTAIKQSDDIELLEADAKVRKIMADAAK